jgi:hypothetical protein
MYTSTHSKTTLKSLLAVVLLTPAFATDISASDDPRSLNQAAAPHEGAPVSLNTDNSRFLRAVI